MLNPMSIYQTLTCKRRGGKKKRDRTTAYVFSPCFRDSVGTTEEAAHEKVNPRICPLLLERDAQLWRWIKWTTASSARCHLQMSVMHTRRIKNTICKAQPDEPDPDNEDEKKIFHTCASHFMTCISVCNAIRLADDSKCKTVFSEPDFNPTLHWMRKTLTPCSVPMMLWALAQCHAEGHDIVDLFPPHLFVWFSNRDVTVPNTNSSTYL